MERLDTLAAVIQEDHEAILADWRNRVCSLPRSRHLDRLTLEDGFRSLLDELSNALLQQDASDESAKIDRGSAVEHGQQRFAIGLDITQVVIEYGMLRRALSESAARHNISLDGLAGTVLHHFIDQAITAAVATFVTAQAARHEARVQERLAMVVHDLKTPLASIHTAAHLMEGRLSPESRKNVHTLHGIILRNCDNLQAMLIRLLERTGIDALHSEMNVMDVPLCSLAGEVIESIRPLAQKGGLSVINDIPDTLRITADPFLLKQVIQNLLSNALKFTEKGRITVGATPTDYGVKMWVQDTGLGMSAERVASLSSQESTPLQIASTGLGLHIVKKIVDAHKGEIAIESEVGKGSTVTITLPSVA